MACDSAGLSKSERVIFGLSGRGGRCGSGLTSSEETLEMETSLSGSGVRGICLPVRGMRSLGDTGAPQVFLAKGERGSLLAAVRLWRGELPVRVVPGTSQEARRFSLPRVLAAWEATVLTCGEDLAKRSNCRLFSPLHWLFRYQLIGQLRSSASLGWHQNFLPSWPVNFSTSLSMLKRAGYFCPPRVTGDIPGSQPQLQLHHHLHLHRVVLVPHPQDHQVCQIVSLTRFSLLHVRLALAPSSKSLLHAVLTAIVPQHTGAFIFLYL